MDGRPHIIINVAQSINGMIAGANGRRVSISSREDWKRVRDLRRSCDGIMIGARTVINDDPYLDTSDHFKAEEKLPARIILDRMLRISPESHVLDRRTRTIVFTSVSGRKLDGAEIVRRNDDELYIGNIVHDLYHMGFRRILVEGGKDVITQFLNAGVFDEFFLFIGNIIIERGGLLLLEPSFDLGDASMETKVYEDGILMRLNPGKLRDGLKW
ncbi:MAG: RibD family protein [Candidatus Thermoplasmatota archaeon]|jgi:riboflavin-specific deaminase-like protein|nr:RibD family protein [Candidatus Thermoplasmatota archaeon]